MDKHKLGKSGLEIGPLVFELQYEQVLPAPETINKNADPTREIEPPTGDPAEIEASTSTVEVVPPKPAVQ